MHFEVQKEIKIGLKKNSLPTYHLKDQSAQKCAAKRKEISCNKYIVRLYNLWAYVMQ